MLGSELKFARDNCNKNCHKCILYRPNAKYKCVIEDNLAWQEWANQEHINFNEELKTHEKQR